MLAADPTPALEFDSVSKEYRRAGGAPLAALSQVSFRIPRGRTVAIIGRSGSGKSTLLHLAAGIEWPSGGRVRLLGRDLAEMGDRERTLQRRESIGLVFQFFHLLSHLSVRENVLLPAWIASRGDRATRARAEELLAAVGLQGREDDSVHRLSGGEMQRVAICRALLRKPMLLLADEPTGSLDDDSSRVVMGQLLTLSSREGTTLLYVTHSAELAAMADETWRLHSGTLDRPAESA
jgi:ABC-type lipoprotein export system ATPase subunit